MLPPIFFILLDGIALGSLYAILALGFTIVWGTAQIVNISLAYIAILCSYLTYWLYIYFGISPLFLIPLMILLGAFINWIISTPLDARLTKFPPLVSLMAYFGIGYFLDGMMSWIWGVRQRTILDPFLETTIGGLLSIKNIVAISAAILFYIAFILLGRTKEGLAIRAVSQNRKGAYVVGVNVKRTYMLTELFAGMGAGITGVLIAITYSFYPAMGGIWIIYMFLIVVVGGMGSIWGCGIAGILLGIIQSLLSYFMPLLWMDVIVYLILIAVLLLLPQGLGGLRK